MINPVLLVTTTPSSFSEDPGMDLKPEEALQRALRQAERNLTGEFLTFPMELAHRLIDEALTFFQNIKRLHVEVLYDLQLVFNTDRQGGLNILVHFLGTAPLGSGKRTPRMFKLGCDWAEG